MTHMLTKKKIQEVANVSEFYDSMISHATAKAKEYTDHLMNEIKYFKTHSYEEIINERANIWTEDREFVVYDDGYNPPQEWYMEMKLQQKYGSDKHFYGDDFKKFFDSMTEEEKKVAHIEGIKLRNTKVIEELRQKDLLYDSMTEEQLKKFLELYYISIFKDKIVKEKSNLIFNGTNEKDPVIPYGSNFVNQSPESVVFEAASIDYMGDKGLIKSSTIKEELKERLWEFLFLGGLSSVALYLPAEIIISLINKTIPEMGDHLGLIPALAGFCAAVFASTYLVLSHSDRKRIIKKAKEIGIYDDFIEQIKAKDDFEKFKDEMEDEYVNEEGARVL